MSATITASRLGGAIQAARAALSELRDTVASGAAVDGGISPDAVAAEWAEAVAGVESIGRLADSVRVRVVDPVVGDFAGADVAQRLGFRSTVDAVAIVAGVSEREANGRLRLAAATRQQVSLTGAPLEARHPHIASGLHDGMLGAEAAGAIVRELQAVVPRADAGQLRVAERNLVQIATGTGSHHDDMSGDSTLDDATPGDTASPGSTDTPLGGRVSVEAVKGAAKLWCSYLDPDGTAPKEQRAMRRRSLRFGAETPEGMIPVSGLLIGEIGHTLRRLVEAHRRSGAGVSFLSEPDGNEPGDSGVAASGTNGSGTDGSGARGGVNSIQPADLPVPARDGRTPEQQRHDAFAAVIGAASRAVDAPELSGTGPAVLVTVTAEALNDPDGRLSDPIGTIDGADTPASRALVERLVETNGHHEVTLDARGAVLGVGSVQRSFTGNARRAIMARDGGCVIPGCRIPSGWTEIHHIDPVRRGGPTHSSNGVCLCWWHHVTIDSGPWRLRTIAGVPHIRGPGTPDWVRARHHSATLRMAGRGNLAP